MRIHRILRHGVHLAAVLALAMGFFALSSVRENHGWAPAGASTACAPTSSTSGSTTTLVITAVGSCTWSPPAGVSKITVTLWGGSGGSGAATDGALGTNGSGGKGAEVTGTLTGIGTTNFELNVGGIGGNAPASDAVPLYGTGGYNGGGNGTPWGGGGGGGASDLRAGFLSGAADRILVAGGGGGGGSSADSTTGGSGGNADAAGTAGAGVAASDGGGTIGGGGGGGAGEIGLLNAGVAGTAAASDSACEETESPGIGGNDIDGGSGSTGEIFGSGGGGGGNSGGGGGGGGVSEFTCSLENAGSGGGGGGESYSGGADGITPTATSTVAATSPNTGNGEIEIAYTTASTTPTSTVAATTVAGASGSGTSNNGTSDTDLALTGFDAIRLCLASALLILLGGLFLAVSRRRRPRHMRGPSSIGILLLSAVYAWALDVLAVVFPSLQRQLT